MKQYLTKGCKNGAVRIETNGSYDMAGLPTETNNMTCDEFLHLFYDYHANNLMYFISEIKRTRKEVNIKFKNGFLVRARPLTKSELYAYRLNRPRSVNPRLKKIEEEIAPDLFERIRNLGK